MANGNNGAAGYGADLLHTAHSVDPGGLLAAIVASSDDAIVGLSSDGTILSWNRAAEEIFGYPAAEALGRSVYITVGEPALEAELRGLLDRIRRGEHVRHYETVRTTKSGQRRDVSITLSPVYDEAGTVAGASKIVRDVTDRKRAEAERRAAEERLREGEDRFRGLMDQAPFSVQIFAPDGRTLRVNRAWEELWGVRFEQISGYNVLDDPQLEAKGVLPHLRRAFAGEPALLPEITYDPEETIPGETRHEQPVRWVSAVAYPVKDAAGAVREVVLVHEDVTARRRAEAEVREKAEALSGILAASVDHLYVVGRDGRYRYVSAGGARAIGFEPDAVVGRDWRELGLPAAVMESFDAQRDEVLRTGRPLRREISFAAPGGEESRYEYVISPLSRRGGEADAVVVVSRDVTARRRAERLLDRYRMLSEHTRDIVLFVRPDGRIAEANAAAEAAYGYDRETLRTMTIADLRHPGTLDALPVQLAAAEAGLRFETVHRRRDGTPFPVEVSSRGAEAGGERLLMSVIRDITDRKRAEDSLRFLAEAGAALAGLTDPESTFQKVAAVAVPAFADWAAVDLLDEAGVRRRVAVAHADPDKVRLAHELEEKYPPEPDAPAGVGRVLRTGEPELVEEIPDRLLEALARDAEHLRIVRELGLKSYLCVPMRSHGRRLGAVTFVTAESGRRYDGADLRTAEDLARRAATAIENARLYAELREADRRKDEFLAMLGHELRNPLAPIQSGLDVLRMSAAEPEVVDLMGGQVEHLVRLVDDLLDVSRILRGRVELKRQPVRLGDVVRRAVETVRPMFEERRQAFAVSLPPDPLRLEADPVRLTQVLSNLLSNAAKYTEPGGQVALSAERRGDEILVRVSDTGSGIDPHLLPHVFDLFTQSTRTIDRSQGGLGLGLTIVKSLVEMHGGAVAAESGGPGRGSTFIVRLPVLEASGAAADAPPEAGGPVPAGLRILVVDDNVPAAKLLVRLLSKLGRHEVVTAHDGEGALAAAEVYRPDLILLDIGLPKLDGYAVARRLRSEPGFAGTVLIALTGYGTEEDRRRSAEAGFDEHVTKPPSVETLRQVLAHPKLKKA